VRVRVYDCWWQYSCCCCWCLCSNKLVCVCVCVCIKLVQSKVHTVCTGGSSSGQLLQRVLWVEEWRRKGIL